MRVKELIEELKRYDETAEVSVWVGKNMTLQVADVRSVAEDILYNRVNIFA